MEKAPDAFRTISEVAQELDLPQHVLRFWETRFAQIRPLKRGGGRRYYRPDDVELLRAIQRLLYGEGYTIKGVQKLLKEQGVRALATQVATGADVADAEVSAPAAPATDTNALSFLRAPAEAQPSSPGPSNTLRRQDLQRLQAVLADLVECERVLAASRAV